MDTKVYPIHIHRKYHDIYTKSLDTDTTQLKYQDTWRKSAYNKEKGLRENLKSKLLTNQFDSGIKMEHGDRDGERKAIKTTWIRWSEEQFEKEVEKDRERGREGARDIQSGMPGLIPSSCVVF